ncbi:MLO-like protein 12, partial [Linum grandiflorum]
FIFKVKNKRCILICGHTDIYSSSSLNTRELLLELVKASMAGASGGRSLEETPTWAVAGVCFVLVLISIIIEHIIHLIGRWLKKKHKRALYQALEKVKAELMLLGFISLLLTVGQDPISRICISKKLGSTWHPCGRSPTPTDEAEFDGDNRRRRLFATAATYYSSPSATNSSSLRRVLAGAAEDKCAAKVAYKYYLFFFVLYRLYQYYLINYTIAKR